ncbi:iron(III) dicitrate transport protein, partial [Helicobacter pylori]
LKKKASLWPKL